MAVGGLLYELQVESVYQFDNLGRYRSDVREYLAVVPYRRCGSRLVERKRYVETVVAYGISYVRQQAGQMVAEFRCLYVVLESHVVSVVACVARTACSHRVDEYPFGRSFGCVGVPCGVHLLVGVAFGAVHR